jgi:hypothetical protein
MSGDDLGSSQRESESLSAFLKAYQDVTVVQEDSAKHLPSNHQPA